MGMSIRGYARYRGVSPSAVHKAIQTGRITLESDATLDPEKADQQWAQNTHQSRARKSHQAQPSQATTPHKTREENVFEPGSNTYMKAKVANEVLRAQTGRVKLQQLKKELVDRKKAMSHVFTLAREQRNAWLRWPARVSVPMAIELGLDRHKLHLALDSYVREHLFELADIKPEFDEDTDEHTNL